MKKHNEVEINEVNKLKVGVVILDFVVSVFQPLVPVVAGAGMLKSVLLLLNMIGVLDKSHSMYILFSTIADVGFYFLPIFIASTTAEKLKCNKLMSIAVVGVLILPAMNSLMADGITIFAAAVRSKDEQSNSTAISAGISALFGITEPAIFGLAFQNKKVLMSVMSGSIIGAIFIGVVGIRGYAVVLPGLASISMFISDELPRNILYTISGAVIAFGSSFIITLLLWKKEKTESKIYTEKVEMAV